MHRTAGRGAAGGERVTVGFFGRVYSAIVHVAQERGYFADEGLDVSLVVEDEDTVRRLTVRALRDLGYATLEASSGSEAIRVMAGSESDVALVVTGTFDRAPVRRPTAGALVYHVGMSERPGDDRTIDGGIGGGPPRDARAGGRARERSAGPAVAVAVVASLLLSAHFLRSFALAFVLLFLLLPWLLAVRRSWAVRVVQVALVFGVFEWITTTVSMLGERRVTGEPAGRMLLIMGVVTGFTLLAALLLETAGVRRRYGLRTGRLFQTAPAEADPGRGDAWLPGVGGSLDSAGAPSPSVPLEHRVSASGPYSEDVAAVAGFAEVFESPDFVAGSWTHPSSGPDGVIQMSYWEPHPDVRRWHDSLYRHGMVLPDFDWSAADWRDSMARLQADPSLLESADLETVRKVLTTAARADRFNEGYLDSLFETGVAQAATRRLGALVAGE